MSEPAWLEAIKDAYMADRASVFLLHGPGTQVPWTLDDRTDDFPDILVSFLSRTREVVGLLWPPQALRFPGIGDTGRFERLLAAAFLLDGAHQALLDDVPEQALGKLWIAMSDATTPQGYVIASLETLYPENRKRVLEIAGGAPTLWEWGSHPRIRASNHIVLLVASDLALVRPELTQAAMTIRVGLPSRPEPEVPDLADTGAAVWNDTLVEPVSAVIPPTPAPSAGDIDLEALADELNTAIREALQTHGEELRPSKIPVMDAVAQVLTARTGSPGPIAWSLDEDGKAVGEGDGAEAFLARWGSDIALDASAGMVIGKLGGSIPDRLDPTGLKALSKRLAKQL